MGLRAVDNRESWQAPEQSPAGEAFQCQAGSPTLTLLQRGVVVVRKAAPLCQACGLRPVAWLSLDVLTCGPQVAPGKGVCLPAGGGGVRARVQHRHSPGTWDQLAHWLLHSFIQ